MKEIVKAILENHTTYRNTGIEKYIDREFEITVSQSGNKVTMWAFNHETDRFINLGTKKWAKLLDGFRGIADDLYSKDHKYYITLKDKNTGVKSVKTIGYIRVRTKGQLDRNSMEEQARSILEIYPNAKIAEESYGVDKDRETLNKVFQDLNSGDTLVVTKLDRFCRTIKEGLQYIELLMERGVKIHILNMGLIEDTPMGKLIITNLLAFSEFEREMIIERTQNGKAIARTKTGFKEGRPREYTQYQLDSALSMLTVNGGESSYTEVAKLTKISKSTLIREQRKQKVKDCESNKGNTEVKSIDQMNIKELKSIISLRSNLIKTQNISETSMIYTDYLKMIERLKELEKPN